MSLLDLFALIIDNLNRRKARVALTAVGVVIGTAAVVVLVSLGIGQQRNATEQLGGIGDLTMIQVEPYFDYGPEPVRSGSGPAGLQPQQTVITEQSLVELAALPGVVSVIPRDFMQANGILYFNRLETWAGITGVGIRDLNELNFVAKEGTLVLERGKIIIGEMVPSSFWNPRTRPGQEPPPPPDLLNQQLKLTLMKWDADGNEIRKNVQVEVIGVIAGTRGDTGWSMYMPIEDVTAYNEWALGRRINRSRDGYPFVMVKVDKIENALGIADQINALGYRAYTPQTYIEGINSFYLLQQVVFGGVGAIALLVAAIGIANTMAMAILERTREIGLMKAIGATNRDVLTVFLGESAGIGFLGGLGGVILGWSFGQVINVVALAYLAGQVSQTGGPPPSVAVHTPVWLPVFALIFATIIGLLSGLYPALRAANLIPVNALKYE
jgi:putative ABC transport system permease protein